MQENNFWNDKETADKVINELKYLKNNIEGMKNIKNEIEDFLELIMLAKEENNEEIINDIIDNLSYLNKEIDLLEVNLLLNGEFDKNNAIIDIHAGAGGTEACDWAMMLERMYLRWCEKKGYKIEIIDEQSGEEAGIKSASFIIKGINAYGYLKSEKGVHRLVRISPFDSNARRHTSFASIDVTPIFENNKINIEIKESDLRIDVYHSSGAGGQSVNTTDSAVRITHIPTKIVITCQNERSQLQNKAKAMELLRNKLYQLELEKREESLKNIKGTNMNIEFGSQIRNYVMHPYSLVKDLRTNIETSNVDKVLDGDLDIFIESSLRRGRDVDEKEKN